VIRNLRPVVMTSWLVALAIGASSVLGCPRKPDEPDPTQRKTSAPSVASSGAPAVSAPPSVALSVPTPASGDAGIDAPLTAREKREMHEKLHNELCELAAKHQNKVYGRPELDKKGTLLITGCLFEGNTAWYRCIMDTQTPQEFEWCSARYMRPADDIK
jgi:hypothetical protein